MKHFIANIKGIILNTTNILRNFMEIGLMNNTINQEDEDWLDALAGNPRPGMDPLNKAQALVVRDALLKQQEEIKAYARTITPEQKNKMRQRLIDAGLLEPKDYIKEVHTDV